jgi:hypothetical protein
MASKKEKFDSRAGYDIQQISTAELGPAFDPAQRVYVVLASYQAGFGG